MLQVEAEEELERKALKQYFPDYSLSFEVKTPEEMELDSGQEELGDGSGGEAALEDSLSRLMSEQETAMTLLHRCVVCSPSLSATSSDNCYIPTFQAHPHCSSPTPLPSEWRPFSLAASSVGCVRCRQMGFLQGVLPRSLSL
jgi:hypothetical protein